MWMKVPGHLSLCGGRRRSESHSGGQDRTVIAIIREVKESDAPPRRGDGDSVGRPDPRLSEARRLLQELEEATGAEVLAPARRLADLLEELLEGREGEKN